MKLILVLIVVLLRGNPIAGIELDSEGIEEMLKAMMNEIKDLSGKVNILELQNKELSGTVKELKWQNQEFSRQNQDLSKRVSKLEHSQNVSKIQTEDNLEQRVEKLEELSKYKTLRTCQELANRGLTLSGVYEVDPDGEGIGYAPIEVFCNFETNTTQVFHDKEDMIKVEKCDSVGCATYSMNYFAPKEQIDALMELSETCFQDLDFGCYMAPLRFDDVDQGFWTDKNGNPQIFFHGDNPGTHLCQCGEDNSCVDSSLDLVCNCDSKSPVWNSDKGRITAKELLPIKSFSYGPLVYDVERANVTIGRISCTGMYLVLVITFSCQNNILYFRICSS